MVRRSLIRFWWFVGQQYPLHGLDHESPKTNLIIRARLQPPAQFFEPSVVGLWLEGELSLTNISYQLPISHPHIYADGPLDGWEIEELEIRDRRDIYGQLFSFIMLFPIFSLSLIFHLSITHPSSNIPLISSGSDRKMEAVVNHPSPLSLSFHSLQHWVINCDRKERESKPMDGISCFIFEPASTISH